MPRRARGRLLAGEMLHVWNRAVDRQAVFRRDADVHSYAAYLEEDLSEGAHEIHAFVFMIDHHHIVLRVGRGSLSKALHRVNTRFGAWFNSSVGRTGPVFEGRFKARRIRTDADLLNVVTYVHANPSEAGLVTAPADWPWSGHHAYLDRTTLIPVCTERVLALLDPNPVNARVAYRQRFERRNVAPDREPAGQVIASVCARLGLDRDEFRSSRSSLAADARATVAHALATAGWSHQRISRVLALPVRTVRRLSRRAPRLSRTAAAVIGDSP